MVLSCVSVIRLKFSTQLIIHGNNGVLLLCNFSIFFVGYQLLIHFKTRHVFSIPELVHKYLSICSPLYLNFFTNIPQFVNGYLSICSLVCFYLFYLQFVLCRHVSCMYISVTLSLNLYQSVNKFLVSSRNISWSLINHEQILLINEIFLKLIRKRQQYQNTLFLDT